MLMSKETLTLELSEFIGDQKSILSAAPSGDLIKKRKFHVVHHEIVHLARDMSIALRFPGRENMLRPLAGRALTQLSGLLADELCDLAQVRNAHPKTDPSETEIVVLATTLVRSGEPEAETIIKEMSPITNLCVRLAKIARDARTLG
jgi:hypothetical protein